MSDALTVRALKIDDYDAAVTLWKSVPGIGLNESDTREAVEIYLRRNPNLSAVAVEDSHIVGAVLCGYDGRRGYLNHLAVDASHRRRGVAKKLLRFCFDGLARQGITRCNIYLFTDNDQGKTFWQHNGWRERGDVRMYQKAITPDARSE